MRLSACITHSSDGFDPSLEFRSCHVLPELTRYVLLSSPQDELTMDNISRSGLVNMCRYMGLTPFGSDNFLRFQLRNKLRAITQVKLPVKAARHI